MSQMPKRVLEAWDGREGPAVFVTVDSDGKPNAIYVTCVNRPTESAFVVADNYFDKTRRNILDGSAGALLFMTKERKAYQVKGTIEYCTEGEFFDGMKQWLDPKFPGHAATVLHVKEAYSGAEKLM